MAVKSFAKKIYRNLSLLRQAGPIEVFQGRKQTVQPARIAPHKVGNHLVRQVKTALRCPDLQRLCALRVAERLQAQDQAGIQTALEVRQPQTQAVRAARALSSSRQALCAQRLYR